MNIQLKNKTAKIHKIYPRRAYVFCPFHESLMGTPDLSIDLEGEYSGTFHCWSCNMSGKITSKQLEWLRSLRKNKPKQLREFDWAKLAQEYYENEMPDGLSQIETLMITQPWLAGWDGKAWILPLREADNKICGIQRVFRDRRKCCVEGSKLGLMVPQIEFDHSKPLYVCEGWSDSCIALECGVQVIGRPSCDACSEMLTHWLCLHSPKPRTVIVVCDNDKPGIKGARDLCDKLGKVKTDEGGPVFYTGCYCPPTNDLRALYESKGKKATIEFLKGE